MQKKRSKKLKIKDGLLRSPFSLVIFILLVLYVISFLAPLLWAFMTSFKSRSDYIMNTWSLPEVWKLSNYVDVFEEMYVPVNTDKGVVYIYTAELIFNALFYTICSTIVTVFSRCFAAYAAARYGQYFIVKLLYPIVLITMLLPIVGSLPAELNMLKSIGAYNNVFALILMKGGFLGLNFLIFYATFKGISWEYAEAAFVDGASHAKVLFSIMVPMARATTSALMLLTFINFWNDWHVNVVYLPDFPMISYALIDFQENTTNIVSTTPHKLAASMLVTLPMLALFLTFRHMLMGNLTLGGLKG